ncbi:MAG: hypothetical protein HY744_19110 [Deltaproteobacteria bacterium]|nr:hypothetical protein [Deltaproteobacteria bacterium]
MDGPWKPLCEAGVPWGAVRPAAHGPFDGPRVRRALGRVALELDAAAEGQRDALLAWLHGFRHHWPQRYAAEIGADGDALAARLAPADENRYLKLRRIAIENLAGML